MSLGNIQQSIIEMSQRYVPLMQRLEQMQARDFQQRVMALKLLRRQQTERAVEDEARQSIARRRLREQILFKQSLRSSATIRDLWKQRWTENRTPTIENETSSPISVAVEDTLQWISSGGKPELDSTGMRKGQKEKKIHAKVPIISKPDPFAVAAAMYKDVSGSRLVCRKCDHTLSRGARGVHLFSWYDNYHLALNEEIADTVSYKEITDASELRKSPWKRAKVACPCCGSSVGSMGVANGRTKVMFKGANVAWRKSSELPAITSKQLTVSPKALPEARPLGIGLSASWLQNNAGLMTHSRRWVLDSTVLHKLVAALTDANSPDRQFPPTPENEQSSDCVVRSSEKDPSLLSDSMKKIALRSGAFETVVQLSLAPSLKGLSEALGYYEGAFSKLGEDVPNASYESSISASKVFVYYAAMHKLAVIASDPLKAPAVDALMKTPKFKELTRKCESYLRSSHIAVDYLPARILCSAARLMTDDQESLLMIVKILEARKAQLGPTAAAFGRSAEYLETALKRSGMGEAEVKTAMAAAGSLHPTPGGRFGQELEPNGFAELFCTHGDGVECNKRATHAPPPPAAGSSSPEARVESLKARIPIFCRIHAPPGYHATAEGYRGVIPPSEDPLTRGRSSEHRSHHQPPWYRRKTSIVEVPDEGKTEPSPPEAGTLFLGEEWERKVKVIYEIADLEHARNELEAYIAKATELMGTHPQNLPSPETAIGVDVEWKPEFVFDENNRVCSIIQVATRERTYVFDAIQLGAALDPLMKRLLRSKAIMKVGHGMGEDFARIAQGLSKATGIPQQAQEYFPIESVLELSDLFCKAEGRVYSNGARPSLAAMVEAATGSKLDKRCQMTDWERRPLSPAQVRYAATDAACGLMMFDVFSKKIAEAANITEINLAEYLQKDEGSTRPQRAQTQTIHSAFASPSGMSRNQSWYAPPRQPSGVPYPPVYAHGAARYPGIAHPRAVPRIGPHFAPRVGARKVLSKYELRRVRELKHELTSQGVRVDEHAKLEGLEVASGHLQKSLNRVVRETLLDAPLPSSGPTNGR